MLSSVSVMGTLVRHKVFTSLVLSNFKAKPAFILESPIQFEPFLTRGVWFLYGTRNNVFLLRGLDTKNDCNGGVGQSGMIHYKFEVIFIFQVVFSFDVVFLFGKLSSFLKLS